LLFFSIVVCVLQLLGSARTKLQNVDRSILQLSGMGITPQTYRGTV
jgi:hypothetical protein